MKIAHLVCVSRPYYSGISNSALQLALTTASFDFDTDIITPLYDKTLPIEEKYKNITIKRLRPILKTGNAALLPGLIKELNDYDIVHLHYPFYGGHELVWLAKNLLGKRFKIVLHYHMNVGKLPLWLKLFQLPTKLIFPSLISSSAKIICSSTDYLKHNLPRLSSDNREKICELPFGIDINKFIPNTIIAEQNNFSLLFVGALDRAHSFKGLNILLDALALLDEKITLTIVGSGDMEHEYRQQAEKNQVANRVIFLGRVDEKKLIKHYQNATALVLPSINEHEAFGIVLIEAMACGLPVIASALPGVRTVFQDKIQGLLIKPADINDLKDKIQMIIENKSLRNNMAINARKLAEKKYSLEIISKQLKNIYDSI